MLDCKLQKEIESYCKLNELDTKKFINNLLKKAFMVEKYGEKPMGTTKITEKFDEKEKITANYEIRLPKKKEPIKEEPKEKTTRFKSLKTAQDKTDTDKNETKIEPIPEKVVNLPTEEVKPKKILKRKLNE